MRVHGDDFDMDRELAYEEEIEEAAANDTAADEMDEEEPKDDPYGPTTTEEQGTLRSGSVTFTTEGNSRYVVNVDVARGETDMLLTLTTGDDTSDVYFYQVIDPEGTLVFDGDKQYHKAE